MALINCPDCGTAVSSSAKQCPNCGCNVKEVVETRTVGLPCCCLGGCLVCVFIVFLVYAIVAKEFGVGSGLACGCLVYVLFGLVVVGCLAEGVRFSARR